MIEQLNMQGLSKVEVAIMRLQTFEPKDGYYLSFSGGKDSVVIKALADMAGVKYDAHYNVTSVDPPELIYFIRQTHPDVNFEYPRYSDGTRVTMWNLIPKNKMPPTRIARYCCAMLKETGGKGRFVVTGVRWAESARRKNSRAGFEIHGGKDKGNYDPDNPPDELMARTCQAKGKKLLNPIIDWGDEDVWEFIRKYNVPYCKLYDEGFTRIGCIGCPMSARMSEELKRYPKFRHAYLRAFGRMIEERKKQGKDIEDYRNWETPESVMEWWVNG